MIYIVCYELKQPASSFEDLFDVLKSQSGWAHYIAAMWLIDTDKTAKQLYDDISGHLFDGDRVFISRLSNDRYGLTPNKAWDWIKRHLPQK
jgi:hypothetical protein